MDKILLFSILFISIAAIVYQLHLQYTSENIEKSAGLEERRAWSKRASLVKTFYPLIKFLDPVLRLIPVPHWVDVNYKRWLITANLDAYIRVNDLIGLQLILPLIFYWLGDFWFESPLLTIATVVLGFFAPVIWLKTEAKERQLRILRELPGVVDMIALSVRAGLDFEGAIRRIVANTNTYSDVLDEFAMLLKNLQLGMSRSDALEVMAQRVNIADIYSFVSVLVQADKLGASISETLVMQARKLREERFLRAEKAGAAAAQKMMLPMMVFIFPLIFIMILSPFFIRYFYGQ